MNSTIFLPKKIKVGFNLRQDTYTGMLGFVIPHDGKKWRQEVSWENWRQKPGMKVNAGYELDKDGKPNYRKQIQITLGDEVNPIEFTNEPMEGFVLNKKAGGKAGSSSSWNIRNEVVRVYDPRNFEFEISVPNLLYILENANSYKGKGLEGKFIYGWDGKNLVLIPEESPEYQNMVKFTELQSKNVKKDEMIKGATYLNNRLEKLVYIDRVPVYEWVNRKVGTRQRSGYYSHREEELIGSFWEPKTQYVFWDEKKNWFVFYKDLKKISELVSREPVINYAELNDKWYKQKESANITGFEFDSAIESLQADKKYESMYGSRRDNNYVKDESKNEVYRLFLSKTYNGSNEYDGYIQSRFTIENGVLKRTCYHWNEEVKNMSQETYNRLDKVKGYNFINENGVKFKENEL